MISPQAKIQNTEVLHPLFAANPSLWAEMPALLQKRLYKPGDTIFTHGDAARSLWLVYSGWVKLSRQTPDGKETIVGLCTKGDVFGDAAAFSKANFPYTAEVISEHAELASIPASTVRELIARDSGFSKSIMSLLNQHMCQSQLKLEHMCTMSATQRLGCFLLRLCHAQESGPETLHIPVEKNVLAAFLGMKPETFSRSQQQLKPIGISVSGPTVTVSNVNQLREFVCNSCSESGACAVEDSAH